MPDFSAYDIPVDKYKHLLAAYLQNEGTQLMNKVLFRYQLVNNYKERLVEFWSLFDIDWLENEYITWKRSTLNRYELVGSTYLLSPTGTYIQIAPGYYKLATSVIIDSDGYVNDSEWIYTGFLENICNSYQITREYYSYWATTTEDPDNPNNMYETGNILLNNLNMIRLLKMKRTSIGFDGSREKLIEILSTSLNNRYSNDANAEINFLLRTVTEVNNHASLQIYIIKPSTSTDDIIWTNYDLYLAKDNKYFIELLGISTLFDVLEADTLVFDISTYDGPEGQEKRYK